MMSWAVCPGLAPGRPAGLSAAIVGGELRQRLRFGGVTITDALEAGALPAFGAVPNPSPPAAPAGKDPLPSSGPKHPPGAPAAGAPERGPPHGHPGPPGLPPARP